jgi:hypothetical protein
MAQPSFWQNARSAFQGSPDDDLQSLLAMAGQKGASPQDIATLDAQPVAPITGDPDLGRSPASAPVAAKKTKKPAPAPAKPDTSPDGSSFDLSNPYPGLLRGGFLDKQHEDELKNSQQQSRVFFMDPEVQKQRMEELSKIPQFANLIQGNKDYKDLVAMEAQRPSPVDLSGAMGMADILSNGKYNLRAGYKPPSAEARTKELLSNLDKAQDNDRQTAQALTSLASSGKAGNDIITAATMLMDKSNQGYKDLAARRYSFDNPVNNAFKLDASSEKIIKPYRDAQDGIDKAIGLLANNASVSDLAATLETVKPMVSRLTNFEWSKIGRGGTALGDRVQQAYSTIVNGTLTDSNREQYRAALQTIREANDAAAQFAIQGRQQLGKAAGIPQNLLDSATKTHYQAGVPKKPAAPAATPPGRTKSLQDMTQEELDAYEKSLRGGK